MTNQDLEAFRALARSSPWRWRSLQLIVDYVGERLEHPRPVRARVARPSGLRVEEMDGTLISASWADQPWGSAWDDDGFGPLEREMYGPQDARAAAPLLRPDGLVAERPAETGHLRYDDLLFQSYRWVAMLDPVELADGDALVASGRRSAALSPISREGAVRVVQRGGRTAWEAVIQTTGHYLPRCTCCPALSGVHSHQRDNAEQGLPPQQGVATRARASAHRVRLDLATGVLVLSEEQGGDAHGRGWHATIESVDQDMPRALFS